MATEAIKLINQIYEDIIDKNLGEPLPKIENHFDLESYVKSLVEAVFVDTSEINEYYDVGEDTDFELIHKEKLKEFMQEIVALNLYENVVLMHQILTEEGLKKEIYIRSKVPDNNKTKIELYKSRLKPNRLNRLSTIELKDHFGCKFYFPSIQRCFEDILFVQEFGTNIKRLSKNYIDILDFLILDEINLDRKHIQKIIKSYNLVKLSRDEVEFVEGIYDYIRQRKTQGDSTAELLLMEKMFCLCNIRAILDKNCSEEESIKYARTINYLSKLGFSNMHKHIIGEISSDTIGLYHYLVSQIVYPICTTCLKKIINSLVFTINDIKREEVITKLEKIQKSDKALLKKYKNPLMVADYKVIETKFDVHNLVRALHGFDKNAKIENIIYEGSLYKFSDPRKDSNTEVLECGFTNLTFVTFYDEQDLLNSDDFQGQINDKSKRVEY